MSATVTGDANQDGNDSNDRLPGVSRNSLVGPDYATTDLRIRPHRHSRRSMPTSPARVPSRPRRWPPRMPARCSGQPVQVISADHQNKPEHRLEHSAPVVRRRGRRRDHRRADLVGGARGQRGVAREEEAGVSSIPRRLDLTGPKCSPYPRIGPTTPRRWRTAPARRW